MWRAPFDSEDASLGGCLGPRPGSVRMLGCEGLEFRVRGLGVAGFIRF